ncbi:hypothetical protein [Nonomuraea sp. NPDC005501]|uniref:hypothetical protein n=1 Tax=Nonomuraea sp. NPDC005501 TaxID=3156884 RepID=UPI0033ACD558
MKVILAFITSAILRSASAVLCWCISAARTESWPIGCMRPLRLGPELAAIVLPVCRRSWKVQAREADLPCVRGPLGCAPGVAAAAEAAREPVEISRLPMPDNPDHHFVFDHGKRVFYAATWYTWLVDDDRAEEHARETLQMHTRPDGTSNATMRFADAHMDIGIVHARRGGRRRGGPRYGCLRHRPPIHNGPSGAQQQARPP